MDFKVVGRVFKALRREAAAQAQAVPAMRRVLSVCRTAYPSPTWKRLLDLDMAEDIKSLSKWTTNVLKREPPPDSINALWFGVFDTGTPEQGVTGCQLYIAGSDHFDPKDETLDWACDPAWFPERREARSKILSKVYRVIGRDDPEGEAAELARYIVPLAFATVAVIAICKTVPTELLLGKRKTRAVAVGYDGGDWLRLNDVRGARASRQRANDH